MIASLDERDRPHAVAILAMRLDALWTLVLVIGCYGAAFGWRPGALLMLTALCGLVAGHLVAGFTEYRRIMRKPWPQVAALDDDDDDW